MLPMEVCGYRIIDQRNGPAIFATAFFVCNGKQANLKAFNSVIFLTTESWL